MTSHPAGLSEKDLREIKERYAKAIPVTEYVAGLLFCNQMVALVLKARPEWQRGRWNGIGGHIESGETPLQAMTREFTEETGVEFENWEHFATLKCDTHNGLIFWFRGEVSELVSLEGEADEPCEWHDSSALPPTIPNIHWLSEMAHHRQRHDWPFLIEEQEVATDISRLLDFVSLLQAENDKYAKALDRIVELERMAPRPQMVALPSVEMIASGALGYDSQDHAKLESSFGETPS